jgi:hypothetical protein
MRIHVTSNWTLYLTAAFILTLNVHTDSNVIDHIFSAVKPRVDEFDAEYIYVAL